MTVPDTAAWLPNLRTVILHHPDRAVTYLRRLTNARSTRIQPAHRIDAYALLAETYLRLGQPHLAADTATAAEHAARAMEPLDWPRLIVVQAITADIAVRTRQTDAIYAASDFYAFVSTRDPDRTHTRIGIGIGIARHQRWAAALLAVAIYHTDPATGRRQLAIVRDTMHADDPSWEPGLSAVTAGLHTMHHPHDPAPRAVPEPIPPMPGGYLHPDLHHPPDGYLPDRITAHQTDPTPPDRGTPAATAAVQRCGAWPAGSRPQLTEGGSR